MRVAILWTHLSGYLNSCMKALVENQGVELFVANIRVSNDAPFDDALFSWIKERYQWEGEVDRLELLKHLENFRPDVILACGWHVSGYRFVCRKFSGRAVRILTTDQPWQIRPKKLIGVLISRYYIHPLCEALFVGGERQAVYAKKLGFHQSRILRGVFSCDHEKFAAIHFARKENNIDSRAFAYVGRLSTEKGLDILVAAYRLYREKIPDPWHLKCYGTGPLHESLKGVVGIELKGFCQPDELPKALLSSSCLLLPSLYEPWALVVHEAAAAGMAVICTDIAGASVHLVQDGYNGYIVETGDVNELAQTMLRYSSLSRSERSTMGENSYRMSLQFTPKRWANYLVSKAKELTNEQYGKILEK